MSLPPIAIPFIVMTAFWGLIGIVVPCLIPKGPNKGLTQLILAETAVCCYLFWICTYLMQLNPLLGPQLHNDTVLIVQHEWSSVKNENLSSSMGHWSIQGHGDTRNSFGFIASSWCCKHFTDCVTLKSQNLLRE